MDGLSGMTAIETTDGVATVIVVNPLIDPEAAVMVATPCVTACASPVEFTGATDGAEDDHPTTVLIFTVSPPDQVPVATNCS